MASSTRIPWIRTNKYLVIVFTILLCITIPLAIFTLFPSSPTLTSITNIFYTSSSSKSLLHKISSGSMDEDAYAAFSKNVADQAKTADYVEVANCSLVPSIIKAQINSAIEFRNSDTKLHYITLPDQKPIRIEPRSSVTIPLSFAKSTPTIFGIGCDSQREAAGILYITQ